MQGRRKSLGDLSSSSLFGHQPEGRNNTAAQLEPEQIGSASSINSFVSARSDGYPTSVSADLPQSSPSNTAPMPNSKGQQTLNHRSNGAPPLLGPLFINLAHHQQGRAVPKSQLSTASTSISDQQRHRSPYGPGSLKRPPHTLLAVPSLLVSPPTPILPSFAARFSPMDQRALRQLYRKHRGELTASEQYRYALSRAQLKASSRTSALLSGFAMIALVELIYQKTTPHALLISLAVVTTLLVSVHLLTLLMSTCLLPYIEAHGCTKDSPHVKLKFYVDLSWLFSTFFGLILFLVEIVIIFFVKFDSIGFYCAAWITTAILVPVLIFFVIVSYLIQRTVTTHFVERNSNRVGDSTATGNVNNNRMMGTDKGMSPQIGNGHANLRC